MRKISAQIIIAVAVNTFSTHTVAWDLDNVFAGMSTNVTPPGSYHDQAAGYYSGGGFSMRTNKASFAPFSMTPPSLKMGCGGIDMFLGSFSMISGQQLVRMVKSIGTQSASYGFQLALKTFAPQIENLLKDLRNLAMELNEFAVEDCQMVQSAFGAVLSKDSAMYETVCKDLERQSGAKDYFKSREGCADHKRAREVARKHQKNSKNEVLLDNFNMFVIAARKAKIPQDMIEATMAITGTIIVKDGQRTFRKSLVPDDNTFTAHLKGGIASIYVCDNADCLVAKEEKKQKISAEKSYQGKANKKILAIKMKMLQNTAFSKEDKDFLSSIGETFPIYNYLSLEVISGVSIIDKSSDLVATYMIVHYLKTIVAEVRQIIQILEGKQINDQHFKDYLEHLDKVQDVLHAKHVALIQRAYQVEERALYIENHHMAKVR